LNVSEENRLPSPQRGRGAGGEGEFPRWIGPCRSMLGKPFGFQAAKGNGVQRPLTPRPSPPRGGEGNRVLNFSQLQGAEGGSPGLQNSASRLPSTCTN